VLYSFQSYTTLESGLIYTLHAFNNDSCRIRLVKLSVTALSVCIRLVLDTSLLFGSRYCVYSKVLARGQRAADEYCDRGTRVDINLLTFHKSNSKYTRLRSCRPTYNCWNTRRADETTFSLSLSLSLSPDYIDSVRIRFISRQSAVWSLAETAARMHQDTRRDSTATVTQSSGSTFPLGAAFRIHRRPTLATLLDTPCSKKSMLYPAFDDNFNTSCQIPVIFAPVITE